MLLYLIWSLIYCILLASFISIFGFAATVFFLSFCCAGEAEKKRRHTKWFLFQIIASTGPEIKLNEYMLWQNNRMRYVVYGQFFFCGRRFTNCESKQTKTKRETKNTTNQKLLISMRLLKHQVHMYYFFIDTILRQWSDQNRELVLI